MLKLHRFPEGEPISDDFSVKLNGIAVNAYTMRVSAIPFNRVWPGQQRPLDQTEFASFVYFGMDEPVKVELCAAKDFSDVAIRPLSRRIQPEICGRNITFTLEKPCQITVELDGFHHALHIFANPVFDFGVEKGDPNVIYFGEGIHDVGHLELKSGQTLFLDAGAVVRTAVVAYHAKNIRIVGEGILDNSWEERESGKVCACSVLNSGGVLEKSAARKVSDVGCMKFFHCTNVEVSGIICRDSSVWTATIFNSDNVIFDNIKAIGMWRYNSDGIDFVNSANGVVKNCFLRNFDDVVVLKGLKGFDTRNVENIKVSGCVIWCDWGRGLEIGAETCADEYRNILFEDCDLIHGAHMNMDLQNGDRARVHDLIFDNIRVEYSRYTLPPEYQHSDDMVYDPGTKPYLPELFFAHLYNGIWSKDYLYGENYNVTFRNIYVHLDDGLPLPPSTFVGVNAEHQTHDITIDGLYINGRKIETLEQLPLKTNEFAYNINIR